VDPKALTFDVSGSYLYVANSGSDNLSAYAVNGATGVLSPLSTATYATGTGPSAVLASSDGDFVFVANSGGSDDISVFAIAAGTGALTRVVRSPFPAGGSPHGLALTPSQGPWDSRLDPDRLLLLEASRTSSRYCNCTSLSDRILLRSLPRPGQAGTRALDCAFPELTCSAAFSMRDATAVGFDT
jgi:Lactonase, 7-bladed beta-propeller